MAKKDKDAIYADYLAELKSAVGEDKWASIEENLVKNEKASAKLRDGVLARSEFSQQMDALKAERESFSTEVSEARSKIQGWQNWYGTASAQVADMQSQLDTYKQTYGTLDGAPRPQGMSERDFQAKLNEELRIRDTANLKFATDLVRVERDHSRNFPGEDLDFDSVYKIAGERQLPLDQAYKVHIADRLDEKNKREFAEAIKKAKEEGAAEFAATHKLPNVPNNPTLTHTLDVKNAPIESKDRIAAAVQGFNTLLSKR